MLFLRRLWSIRQHEDFRLKMAEMATEFCLEASVLISVLGILDSAISEKRMPSVRVFEVSLAGGLLFFGMGCILQAGKYLLLERNGGHDDPGDR